MNPKKAKITNSIVPASKAFLGLDLGTGGARLLAADETGRVLAESRADYPSPVAGMPADRHEQDPLDWWLATVEAGRKLATDLLQKGHRLEDIAGLAVDGTSGTIACVDAAGEPLRPAIMYNDGRAAESAAAVNAVAADHCAKLGYRFDASFAISKLLWMQKFEPEVLEKTTHVCHHADFIIGRLTGDFSISDYSNALKTGYDLLDDDWPVWMDHFADVRERLPRVVPPGTVIGRISPAAAGELSLPAHIPVVSGASDGTAGCLASGIQKPGDANTTLGTTLIFKVLSPGIALHPDGTVYSHKLPGDCWLPGAASNTGGQWIQRHYQNSALQAMDDQAARRLPNSHVAYPLARTGERFPFLIPNAEGFCEPEPLMDVDRYAACLQGTAFVERLCYEILDDVTGSPGGDVFATGGGSRSDVWLQCRADVTGRVYHRPQAPEAAHGAAVLAATGTHFEDLWAAIRNMVHMDRSVAPDPVRKENYNDLYGRFRDELRRRKYLPEL